MDTVAGLAFDIDCRFLETSDSHSTLKEMSNAMAENYHWILFPILATVARNVSTSLLGRIDANFQDWYSLTKVYR